jgi:hypothetical protein
MNQSSIKSVPSRTRHPGVSFYEYCIHTAIHHIIDKEYLFKASIFSYVGAVLLETCSASDEVIQLTLPIHCIYSHITTVFVKYDS